MNWEAIGAVGDLLGAMVVFASVVYLAVQIRLCGDIEYRCTGSTTDCGYCHCPGRIITGAAVAA